MVTAGTHEKRRFLNAPVRLDLVPELLFGCASEFEWQLQASAVMSNHYHLVAFSPKNRKNLGLMPGKLHSATAREFNAEDGTAGRPVFYQYCDTQITFQRWYLARLNCVHKASEYHGCSAAWFERSARAAFVKGRLQVSDGSDPSEGSESGGMPPHSPVTYFVSGTGTS